MLLQRFAVCLITVFIGLPLVGIGSADGAFIRRTAIKKKNTTGYKMNVVVNGSPRATAVTARIKSDAGKEDVALVQSGLWLHGRATIPAFPNNGAALKVTLYDFAGISLMGLSGWLGTDGSVTLTVDPTEGASGGICDATSKTGCAAAYSDTSAAVAPAAPLLAIEVLAGDVFPAANGYSLGLNLSGTDADKVAFAAITLTESAEVTTCGKVAACTAADGPTITTAEVGWDAVGEVWEGEVSTQPTGAIDVKVKAYDAKGELVDSAKTTLGVPWRDGGEGIDVLAIDEDPLTMVGFVGASALHFGTDQFASGHQRTWRLVVNSQGWSATDALPAQAQVELTNGGTLIIPVNSYQRRGRPRANVVCKYWSGSAKQHKGITITGGNIDIHDASALELTTPTCSNGTCVTLVEDEAGCYDLSVSEYGTDASKLADHVELTVTVTDIAGETINFDSFLVEFDAEITAVFANEIRFSEDPIGLDLSGQVRLFGGKVSGKADLLAGAATKAKQKTLAKGKFHGGVCRDGDGDLSLAGADKQLKSQGSVVVAGDAVAFELLVDTNGNGVLDPPPLVSVARSSKKGASGEGNWMVFTCPSPEPGHS